MESSSKVRSKLGWESLSKIGMDRWLLPWQKHSLLPFSVIAMEVITAGKALRLARDLGLSSIMLERDSKTTIDALLCESPSLTDYGHLVDETRELAKDFSNIEFGHVLRQGNSSTNNICKTCKTC